MSHSFESFSSKQLEISNSDAFIQFKDSVQLLMRLCDEMPVNYVSEAEKLFMWAFKIITKRLKQKGEMMQETNKPQNSDKCCQVTDSNIELESKLNRPSCIKVASNEADESLTQGKDVENKTITPNANLCTDKNDGQESGDQNINPVTLKPLPSKEEHALFEDEVEVGNFIHLAIEQDDGTVQNIKFEVVDSKQQEDVSISGDKSSKDALNMQPHKESLGNTSHTTATMVTRSSKRKVECVEIDGKENGIVETERERAVLVKRLKGKPGRPKSGTVPPPVVNEKGEKVYKCEVCNASVQKYPTLLVHMRKHSGERPFQCEVCYKSFTTKGNMLAHLTHTHSTDKPWKCDDCGKQFKEKKVLKIHQRIHTGERPFRCSQCDKSFTQSCVLKEHMLIHAGKKPHLCDLCGQEFRTASNLKIHKKRHMNLKNYICELCNKAFVTAGALQKHMVSHTGERKFACDICKKTFAYLTSLKQHEITHHSPHQINCEPCALTFSDKTSYLLHRKLHETGNSNIPRTRYAHQRSSVGVNPQENSQVYSSSEADTIYFAADDKFTAMPLEQQMTQGEHLVHMVIDESVLEGEDLANYQSLLISAAANAEISNLENQQVSRQLYQVVTVNPETHEEGDQGQFEGHEVIVQGQVTSKGS